MLELGTLRQHDRLMRRTTRYSLPGSKGGLGLGLGLGLTLTLTLTLTLNN